MNRANSVVLYSQQDSDPNELYLQLLKRVLLRSGFPNRTLYRELKPSSGLKRGALRVIQRLLSGSSFRLVRCAPTGNVADGEGPNLDTDGETMIGRARLDNLHNCIADVVRSKVPGDLIEAGVWRGGAAIFMRGALKAYGDRTRKVWIADSFEGVPAPNPEKYPADAGSMYWAMEVLAVGREEVEANFRRYQLLDDQVQFLHGWFKDTLPTAPIKRLSVLRVDGDIYESTMDVLSNLYPKLSPGGYVIVDDYGAEPACKQAVDDYRKRCGISEQIHRVKDWQNSCVYWQRMRLVLGLIMSPASYAAQFHVTECLAMGL